MTSIPFTSAPARAPLPALPRRRRPGRPVTQVGLAVLAALAVAGVSLLFTHAIGNDPEAWIVWAREAAGPGILQTSGPSWKPLPVILIAPFALLSRGEADVYYWLLVTRAGAVLAVVGVATLARRDGGPIAAGLVALLMVCSPWWFYNALLGNAEPLMVALLVATVLIWEAGYEAAGCVALGLAALVRPELCPLAVLFGAGCVLRGPRRGRRAAYLGVGAGVVLLGWLVPSLIHSGLGASTVAEASTPTAGAAKNAAIPFLAVFKNTFTELTPLPGILAGVALARALSAGVRRLRTGARVNGGLVLRTGARAGGRLALRTPHGAGDAAQAGPPAAAALFGLGWVLVVAVMAQAGFPSNSRYLIPGLAALELCAALEAVRLAGAVRRRQLLVAGVIAASAAAISSHSLHLQLDVASAHTREVARMQREIAASPCAGDRVTFAGDVTTLAQVTDQSIAQTTPPRGLRLRGRRLVFCVPARS